jgi:hypothetical protein
VGLFGILTLSSSFRGLFKFPIESVTSQDGVCEYLFGLFYRHRGDLFKENNIAKNELRPRNWLVLENWLSKPTLKVFLCVFSRWEPAFLFENQGLTNCLA